MAKRKMTYITASAKFGNPIDYPEALAELFNNYIKEEYVYILSPFNRFKDYIFLFPSSSIGKFLNDNESMFHSHRNFILYQNRWHKPRDIFKNIPIKYDSASPDSYIFAILGYYDKYLKPKAYYKMPFSYFDLTTKEQMEFKQEAIQPIRNLFSKFGFLTPDNRGKGSEKDRKIREEVHEVVLAAYKKAKRKRPLPIQFIQKELEKYLKARFSDRMDLYDEYSLSDASIRRILKKESAV